MVSAKAFPDRSSGSGALGSFHPVALHAPRIHIANPACVCKPLDDASYLDFICYIILAWVLGRGPNRSGADQKGIESNLCKDHPFQVTRFSDSFTLADSR